MSPGERKARYGNLKPQRPPQRKERKRNDDRMGKELRPFRGPRKLINDPRKYGMKRDEIPSKNTTTSNNPNESFKKEKRDSEAPPSIKNKKTPTGTVNPNEIKKTIKEKFASSLVGKALKKKKEIQKKVREKVLGVLGLEISKKSRGGLMRKPKLAKRGF